MSKAAVLTESAWFASSNPFELLEFLAQHQQHGHRSWLSWFSRDQARSQHRRQLLFACACCRRIWELLPDERIRAAVEIAERYADGLAARKEMRATAAVVEAVSAAVVDVRALSQRWLEIARAEATQAVSATLTETDPADKTIVAAREAVRAWTRSKPEEVARRFGIAPPSFALEGVLWIGPAIGLPTRPPTIAPEDAWIAEGKAQADLLRDIFGNPFRTFAINPSWRSDEVLALANSIYQTRSFGRLPELADALTRAGCDQTDLLTHCRQSSDHARGCWVIDLICR